MAYTTIDDPSAYFQVATYTGAGANQTVTNDGNSDLQPDWLWIKRRNAGYAHALFDSNRGLGSSNPPMLESDSTAAENSNQNWISGVGTDSFTIGVNEHNLSNTAGTYVAWQWKANGGTTSSNTAGTITSTTQVNSDAGFSIQTFTSASSGNSNWGHGLGSTPDFFMVKRRDGTSSWWMNQTGMTRSGSNWQYMPLNSTSAATNLSAFNADSTTITSSNDFVPNSASMVCYAFKNVQGYSKFGKYVGSGSADGAFVYTGFQPAFVIIRSSSIAGQWLMFDNKRTIANGDIKYLIANATGAESGTGLGNAAPIDFLSNGFKLRNTDAWANGSNTYIYMAFAENPFVTSTGIPTTAR